MQVGRAAFEARHSRMRYFTYVGDLVDGFLRAGYYEKAIGKAINLVSECEINILELATMINQMVENDAGINFVNRRKWDTKSRLLASIDKAMDV